MRTLTRAAARLALCLTAALALAACGGGVASPAGSPAPTLEVAAEPGALRAALPGPGVRRPAGQVAYAGLDETGRVGVAIVRVDDGSVVAYICDGARIWGWFEGTTDGRAVELTGASGTFSADLTGDSPTGTAQVRGQEIAFVLEPAAEGAGLFRDTVGDGVGLVELGWVVTNAGEVTGVARSADTGTAVEGDSTLDDDVVGGQGEQSASPSEENDPLLFRKLRCQLLFNNLLQEQNRVNQGTSDEDMQVLEQRFEDLNCSDFIPTVPDGVADPIPPR